MPAWLSPIITMVCSVIASGGFWAFIQKHSDKNDIQTQLILGLAHDRIISLAMKYIDRGYITKEEYDNLHKYLYLPYSKLGGNGTADRVMKEIEKLEIRPSIYPEGVNK